MRSFNTDKVYSPFKSGWPSIFAAAISRNEVVHRCTLIGKYNDSYKDGSLRCKLQCSNSASNGIKCPVHVIITGSADCHFIGKVFGERNHTTLKRRHLRGDERWQEAALCQNVKPSEREATLLSAAGEVLAGVPTKEQLRKAASERKVAERGCSDVFEALLSLHKQVPQYVRAIHCVPFKAIMWLDIMMTAYNEVAAVDGRPRLYMDSTGGIVRKVYDQKRAIFLVALVMEHPLHGEAQLPVALMLTNSHTTPDYTTFLHSWWWSMLQFNTDVRKPASVTMDFNWPSIHATCTVFNGIDIVRYLKLCKDVICGKLTGSAVDNITILGLGRAHFVHALVRWPECRSKNSTLQLFWRCSLTAMVTMTDWIDMKIYFRHIIIILCAGK